jgi:hypothetical protein
VVGAEGADQVHLARAAHAGDLGSGCLRDLDGERADATGRPDDQHLVPGLDASVVADGLQRGHAGDRDGTRLVEGEVGRLGRELVRPGARVLGEGALADAEHLVAGMEGGHVGADGFNRSGQVPARVGVLRSAEAEPGEPDGIGQAGHDVPGAPVDARRAHAHEDLGPRDRGPVDLRDPQDGLGSGALAILHDRPHGRADGGPRRRCSQVVELGGFHRNLSFLVVGFGGQRVGRWR